MNLYEEACRRINAVIEEITAQIDKKTLPRIEGQTTINGYRVMILEMQQAFLGTDEKDAQYRAFLQQEYVPSERAAPFAKHHDPYEDPVRGIVGFGPECRLPEELFASASSQKPD